MASRKQATTGKRGVVQQSKVRKGGDATKWNGLSRKNSKLSRKKANSLKRTKIRKKSNRTIPKLKTKLRTLLHSMIREAYPRCITCGGKTENAGHFWSDGHFKSVQFDPYNIRGQCVHCNLYLSGNLIVYADKLREEIGVNEYEDLKTRATKMYMDYDKEMLQGLIKAASTNFLTIYMEYYFGTVVPKYLKTK